ncbi:hypothetical protein SAMN04488109_6132 [Chryseolinea serpens]|uniref:Uncharacterized protein n=1 Tax=Chryseolinea serpens TaxID=947013 RepID=A0A1M5WXQ5_9BACT|nr:hypothetical protein [Chryseolinea serpens]SHH92446.1 hypothetical protein SAMN04488109_6132 [Chryseolinea serpens]
MTKISNYDELLAERLRLEGLLREHKATIATEVSVIKEKLHPIFSLVSFLSVFQRKPDQSLLQFGADVGVELLLRQKLLAKSNWITRLVLPFLAKGATAKVLEKLRSTKQLTPETVGNGRSRN